MNRRSQLAAVGRGLTRVALLGIIHGTLLASRAGADAKAWHAAQDSAAQGGGLFKHHLGALESLEHQGARATGFEWPGSPGSTAGPPNASREAGTFTSRTLPGADGNVLSMARAGGTLYLAGSFRSVGDNTGGFAAFDPGEGRQVPILPRVTGWVGTIVSDGTGGWFIGGGFTSVGGLPRENIAHILPDGAVDAWHPSVTGSPGYIDPPIVLAILPKDGRVFIGGAFRMINGKPHENLGCVDARTGATVECDLDVSGTISGTAVMCLAASDSLIYVGGRFEAIAGTERANLGAIDAKTLQLTQLHANVSGYLLKLAYRQGVLWVAGRVFIEDAVQGVRQLFAGLDPRTGATLPFDARAWGVFDNPRVYLPQVRDFAFVGDTVYVAGNFTSIGGQPRLSLAALDAVSGDALPWTPPVVGPRFEGFPPRMCTAMAVVGPTLYVSGYFETMDGESRPYMAAVRRDTGQLLPWNPKPNSVVEALVARGDVLIAGGYFNTAGDWRHRAGLAAIDLHTGKLKPWNPNPNGAIVSSVVAYQDRVFVSGDFTVIGGNPGPRHFLAALDTLNGELLPWALDTNELAEKMFIHDGALYLAGWFTSIGGEPRSRLAAVDPLTGDVLPWAPVVNEAVLATATRDHALYIGGLFTAVNGSPRRGAAAIDLDTGDAMPWNPSLDNPLVESMCMANDRVFLGGGFSYIGGEPRGSIAAVDAISGGVLPWHPETAKWDLASPRVQALAMAGGKLVAGGTFAVMGGAPRLCLAAVDTSTGLADEWIPDPDGRVWSLLSDGPDLYVGGGFTRLGGEPSSGLSLLRASAQVARRHSLVSLRPSLPNPATSTALLRFDLPAAATVTLSVYDLQGRIVAVPIRGEPLESGAHGRPLDVHRWASGIYFCRLDAGGRTAVRKLVIARQ